MDILKDIDKLIKDYKASILEYRHDIANYDDNFAIEEKGYLEGLQRVVKDLTKLRKKIEGVR